VEAVEYFLLLMKCHASEFASSLLRFLLPAPDKAGRFQLILSKRFRFLRFLSHCMLTAQYKTKNLVCRKSVKFTAA